MIEKFIFNENQSILGKDVVKTLINNFGDIKNMIGDGRRNKVKIAQVAGNKINIKAFKTPNLVNQLAYKFLRNSKAERSYEYANRLLNKGIKTPNPIAYLDYSTFFLYKNGYYLSNHLEHDISYRDLITQTNYPNRESILRAFTRFTFQLHENNVNFLDHSPGNTLIRINGEHDFEFYLIDLNRMNFMEMDFNLRMKNFAKLSPKDDMLQIMSNEYAKLYPIKTEAEITERMKFFSVKFSSSYMRKERFKKNYFFWRNYS
jgi:hypothetical protein